MRPLRLIVCGAAGRMGTQVLAAARQDARFKPVGVVVRARSVPGFPRLTSAGLEAALQKADVVIDFSSPRGATLHARAAARTRKPIVIGTTGLSLAQRRTIARAARKTAVFLSPNMSPGMNLLFHLAQTAVERLPGLDAHIVETHHRGKRDAPSGTALRLAEAAGGAPISSLRLGDVAGEHALVLAGPGERLELIHRAQDRSIFARGALRAAHWLVRRRPGLYDFQELLGLP